MFYLLKDDRNGHFGHYSDLQSHNSNSEMKMTYRGYDVKGEKSLNIKMLLFI